MALLWCVAEPRTTVPSSRGRPLLHSLLQLHLGMLQPRLSIRVNSPRRHTSCRWPPAPHTTDRMVPQLQLLVFATTVLSTSSSTIGRVSQYYWSSRTYARLLVALLSLQVKVTLRSIPLSTPAWIPRPDACYGRRTVGHSVLVTTDGQSVGLGIKPRLGSNTRCLLLLAAVLSMWGSPSGERMGLIYSGWEDDIYSVGSFRKG
jgi:hypothetical protein